ncbi:MAG: type II toxin-antitoxin system RelB/DinJ family antitoxin, partial [Gemmiger sp.]
KLIARDERRRHCQHKRQHYGQPEVLVGKFAFYLLHENTFLFTFGENRRILLLYHILRKNEIERTLYTADKSLQIKTANRIAIVRTNAYNKDEPVIPGKEQCTVAKSANLYARIEPDVKEQAEAILSALGIPASNAITMFYKQIILQKGLPFEVKLPAGQPVDVSTLTQTQLDAELEKGYADITAGKTKKAKNVFEDIRRDYGV